MLNNHSKRSSNPHRPLLRKLHSIHLNRDLALQRNLLSEYYSYSGLAERSVELELVPLECRGFSWDRAAESASMCPHKRASGGLVAIAAAKILIRERNRIYNLLSEQTKHPVESHHIVQSIEL
jgi:hypothetical protein